MRRYVAFFFLLAAPAKALDEREDLKNGRVALRRGDYTTAERLLKSVTTARPDAWDIRIRLLEAQLTVGKLEDAEKTCNDFISAHRDHAAAHAALSNIRLLQNDARAALASSDTALRLDATDPRAILAHTQALLRLGRRDEAVRAVEGLADLYPKVREAPIKDPLIALAQGLILRDELVGSPKDYSLAVEHILPDILRADSDPAVRALLGHVYLSRHQPSQASTCFAEALEINAEQPEAHFGLGLLALHAGDTSMCAQAADRVLAIHPSHGEALALKIRIAYWQQDRESTRKRLDEALEKNPHHPTLEALREAILGTPSTPRAHYELGCALMAHRQFKRATQSFEAATDMWGAPTLAHLNRLRAELRPFPIQPTAPSSDALTTNLAKLWSALNTDFAAFTVRGCDVRIPKRYHRTLEPWTRELIESLWPKLEKQFEGAPETVLVIFCEKDEDVATLSTGVWERGGLGRIIALSLPQPESSWAATLTGMLAQSFALHRAGDKALPPWLLSGVATVAAKQAGFDLSDDWTLFVRHRHGQIKGPSDAPAAAVEFLTSNGWLGIDRHGEFDTASFTQWLDKRLATIRYILPPRPDNRRITVADAEPNDAEKSIAAAHDALVRKQLDRAIKYASRAIKADPKAAQAYSLLGQALQKKRKHEEAYENLRKAIELGADDYRIWYATGDVLEDLDDIKGALEAFQRAKGAFPRLAADPEGENVYRRLMKLYDRTKDTTVEMRELAGIVALEPLNARDRKRLARFHEKDPDQAISWLRQLAWLQPRDKWLYSALGAAWALKREWVKAIEMRLFALEIISSDTGPELTEEAATEYCELASLYLKTDQRDKARQAALDALRCVPGHDRARQLYEEATK